MALDTTPKTPKSVYQLPSFILLLVGVALGSQLILLSPSDLESDYRGIRVLHPKDLIGFLNNETDTVIPNLPLDSAPLYSLRTLDHYQTDQGKPNWRFLARKANYFQNEELVHARDVIILLPDQTKITSNEALIRPKMNEMELFGNVIATLPDGSKVFTSYAITRSRPVTEISVPPHLEVRGEKINTHEHFEFMGFGLFFRKEGSEDLHILKDVQFRVLGKDHTLTKSDEALYSALRKKADFLMKKDRPLNERFVWTTQEDLKIRSRTQSIFFKEDRKTEKITATDDVWIEDRKDATSPTTASSGLGEYFPELNQVILTRFPQAYQKGDTLTGEPMIFHRDTDEIEVKESNAISYPE